MKYIIQTENLSFQFSKQKIILDNISINVPKGSIYGFLGPNGAGKSTTMRMLTGIIPNDANNIKLFDKPLNEQLPYIFEKIGAHIEAPSLYLHLSGLDNLRYIAKIRNISVEKIDEVLELVDLTEAKNQKAKEYSLGMKQRLAIAMALLSDPELLILDEPVNGLDPNGIADIRKLLVKLNKEKGITIFISSHLLSEIEKTCTHVGIISKGVLKFEGTLAELSTQFNKCKVQLVLNEAEKWKQVLQNTYSDIELINNQMLSFDLNSKQEIPHLITEIVQKGAEILEIKAIDGLEEWFLKITDN